MQQQVSAWQGANEKLKEEADGITTRLKLLDEAIAEAEAGRRRGEVPCPLCGMLLEPGARERVRAGYQQDINERRQQWKANKGRADAAQKQIEGLNTRINELDEKLKARRMAEKREATLGQNIRAADEAQTRLDREQSSLQAVLAAIDAGTYAEAERTALQTVQAQLAALAYDPNEHRRVSAEAQQLESYERRHADLQHAETNLTADTDRLELEQESVQAHRDRLARERAEETRLAVAVAGLEALRQQAKEQKLAVDEARRREDRLSREEGALARQLEQVAEDEKERAAKATLLTQVTADKAVYEELAKAFGKSGVQAMIIEQVVPELADDANALLGRMTDNRMHLSFETQRAAKTRDSTIETLDIKITDGAGIAASTRCSAAAKPSVSTSPCASP